MPQGPGEGIGTDQSVESVQTLYSFAHTIKLNSLGDVPEHRNSVVSTDSHNPYMVLAWANEQYPKIFQGVS